jgi:hypothetical protein
LLLTIGAIEGFDCIPAETEELEGSRQLAAGIRDAPFELEHQDSIRGKVLLPTGQRAMVHAPLISIGKRSAVAPEAGALLVR